MATALLRCPKCSQAWAQPQYEQASPFLCPGCGIASQVFAWPALRAPHGAASENKGQAAAEGDATCFNHESKLASQACDSCGRFICGLCDVELDGQHQCPRCAAGEGSRDSRFENRHVRWDMVALGSAVLSILLAPFVLGLSFLFAPPAVIYLVLRHWSRVVTVAQDRRHAWGKRLRFVAAFLIALSQIFLVVTLFVKWLS